MFFGATTTATTRQQGLELYLCACVLMAHMGVEGCVSCTKETIKGVGQKYWKRKKKIVSKGFK